MPLRAADRSAHSAGPGSLHQIALWKGEGMEGWIDESGSLDGAKYWITFAAILTSNFDKMDEGMEIPETNVFQNRLKMYATFR